MPLSAAQVRERVRQQGWTFVDLAARWDISVTWMSRLVNQPNERPAMYEDAFNGLPVRDTVAVKRQQRHVRKRKPKTFWSVHQMFPPRRLFEALDNRVVDEGTVLVVQEVRGSGDEVEICFRLADEPSNSSFDIILDLETAQAHLGDLCRDLPG